MFREMRRKAQLLSAEDTLAILSEGTNGVLAALGDDDYPYAVPLNYIYHDGKLYFHCSKTGHKLDAVCKHPKASFCVIGQDRVVPEKFTTAFRSVIAFGRVRVLQDTDEKRSVLKVLTVKFSSGYEKEHFKKLDSVLDNVCVLEFAIEHMTGKEAIELINERQRKV